MINKALLNREGLIFNYLLNLISVVSVPVFDILKFPKVDGIACPELVDYNVRI
ncbi:Uncharacterised protein [Cytobacillus firmus]|nr:Uncharacterised protein [Cytobacillus firmus]